jgi:MFS family permease
VFPGQIICGIASLTLFASYLLAAYLGSSASILIVTLGVLGGFATGITYFYSMNVVARATDKYHPLAMGLTNMGSPIGAMIMPFVANSLLSRWGMRGGLVGLGIFWTVIAFLVVFMVEVDDEKEEDETIGNDSNNDSKNETSAMIEVTTNSLPVPKETIMETTTNFEATTTLPTVDSGSIIEVVPQNHITKPLLAKIM